MCIPVTANPLQPLLLALRGVTKRFGGVTALEEVDFELRRGEIHALLGENGAGKSTLIKVLGGVHVPDSGTIELDGRPVPVRGVADAQRLGIRVIHQELSLAPNLSVAENIYLGQESSHFGWLDRSAIRRRARELVSALGLAELSDVNVPVARLSVAGQQLVEIARALSTEARVLVLDEPTSALSESETEALFVTLRTLRDRGVGIIYISHRLEEIIRLADRITVLRDGRSIGTQPTSSVNQRELVHWMVGREIVNYFHRPKSTPGEVVLEVRNLCGPQVHGVSLQVRRGEILGIAGLVGAGRSELVRTLFGIDPCWSGEVRVAGEPVQIASPRDALRAGMVLVPEDRKLEGLVLPQSVTFNAALPWVARWIRWAWPNGPRRRAIVDRVISGFAVRLASADQPIESLSGGNQQKVLVGRWMEERPRVLLLDEPTRGIDVAAREEMFALLARLVEDGMAVVLISSDLAEVLHMAHRVVLYRDGRVIGQMPAQESSLEEIVHRLTGARVE